MDEAGLAIVAAMHEAGVPLLLGSDLGAPHLWPGANLHDEIALFVRAGVPPAKVLRMATAGAADFLGLGPLEGRVTPGFRADLVLLHATPLTDVAVLREPAGVVLRGRWLDREALHQLRGAR